MSNSKTLLPEAKRTIQFNQLGENRVKKSVLMTILITAFIFTSQVFVTKATPGNYDQSFGSSGFVVFQDSDLKSLSRIAIQKDGKILIAGHSEFGDSLRLFLRRHNSDGSLDTSFGSNGEAVEEISPSNYRYIQMSHPSEIGFQSDGKILIGGRRLADDGTILGAAVWRFTNAGFLDLTFDGDGRKDLSNSGVVMTVKMMIDGNNSSKILVLTKDGEFSFLERLNLSGSYDTNFGNTGKVKINGQYNDLATAKLSSFSFGESIYVAGAENYRIITARRYQTNGSPDTAFGDAGKITLPFMNYPIASFKKVIVQPDGRVLLSGELENPTYFNRGFVVRTSSGGEFEQSFGTRVIFGNIGAIFNPYEDFTSNTDLELQSDGKFIVGRGNSNAYKRYLPNGSEDTAYIQPADSTFHTFALQKNNRLVAVESNWVNGIGVTGYTLGRLLAE